MRTNRVGVTFVLGVAISMVGGLGVGARVARAAPWTPLTNAPPAFLNSCLLLTDGTVMCQQYFGNTWHRLTPDINGSYVNGTWNTPAIPAMPNGNDAAIGCVNCAYSPLFFASAVLPDGRAIVIGGEDITGFPNGSDTNIGFLYSPFTNTWSQQLTEAFGGGNVGDAASIILSNGTFLLQNIKNTNIESFNPTTLTFTALNPTGKADGNNEEGWNILPDGRVLTVDATIASQSEIYNSITNTWGSVANTQVNLADTAALGNSIEVGPGVLRPDGTLVYFSGNSLGQNAVYNIATGTWSNAAAMDFPLVPGQTYHFAVKDGTASLLPDGKVLVMAAPTDNVRANFNAGSHFYEFDLANNLTAVTDSPNAASFSAFHGHFLLLPSGEVLLVAYDQNATQDVMLYSNGGGPLDAWRPAITAAPPHAAPGTTYPISGTLFNGFSQGASYGDDSQSFTNYPLVRIRNNATGHIFYAPTHDHSRMGVEAVGSTEVISTRFDTPPGIELGASTVVVVVNGIPSTPPVPINVSINQPPVARCKNATVSANASCQASIVRADIDNGSSDPDGDAIVCALSASGPFGLGNRTVVLNCVDPSGATGSCNAIVTVVDTTPPVIACPVSVNVQCTNAAGASATFSTGATDNCSVASPPSCSRTSGSNFSLGTTIDTCSVSDGSGNSSSCNFHVTVALGDNPICCPAGTNVILGTSNNETLNGTGGADCILARGGQDVVNGNGGNDFLSGGDGNDVMSGNDGNDVMFGGAGQDTMNGNNGNDLMSGGDGDDQLSGGEGNDTLLGAAGQDRLFGDNGIDRLVGETGDDRLEGGAGTDTLIGGGLHDVCIGGPDVDTFLMCESQTQ